MKPSGVGKLTGSTLQAPARRNPPRFRDGKPDPSANDRAAGEHEKGAMASAGPIYIKGRHPKKAFCESRIRGNQLGG